MSEPAVTAKHLPWHINKVTLRFGDGMLSHQIWSERRRVALIESHLCGVHAAGDLAEFIVRACNSHEALVKALRAMVATADSDGWNECGPLIDARDALRLAEGEKP